MSNQTFLPASPLGLEVDTFLPSSLGSPEWCEEHKEFLSVFCLDDLEPLCKQCAADMHAGHRVYPATEAAIDCKEELKTSLNRLNTKMNLFEQFKQTCQRSFISNQTEARLTEEQIKIEFEDLHQFLRQEEATRINALTTEKEERVSRVEGTISEMNKVIKSLEEKIQLIERELDTEGDGAEFLQHYEDTMSSTWINNMKPQKMYRPLIDVAKHVGNLLYDVWKKIKHMAPYTSITFDPRTAGQTLKVSPELNRVQIVTVSLEDSEKDFDELFPVPANPERFHASCCVLSKEGFQSGEHSWDVEVGEIDNWTLGVASQSVQRGGEFEVCPEAGFLCISLQDGEYQALTRPIQILKSDSLHHLRKVHLRLDCDGGMLEFINAETNILIFAFTHCFAEIVHPYFESRSAGGSLALLAQEVSISLCSDFNPPDSPAVIGEDQEMKPKSSTEKDVLADSNHITKINSKHVNHNKESKPIVLIRENTKQPETVKTSQNAAMRKQNKKFQFNVAYHVSLNKALNRISQECVPVNVAVTEKA